MTAEIKLICLPNLDILTMNIFYFFIIGRKFYFDQMNHHAITFEAESQSEQFFPFPLH